MKTYSCAAEITVGVVGYGGAHNMGRQHLQQMQAAGMTPIAVAEVDPARLAVASQDFPGIKTYSSVEAMLELRVDLIKVRGRKPPALAGEECRCQVVVWIFAAWLHGTKTAILDVVKLIAQLQLKPTKEQAAALQDTLKRANAACDFLSALAWDNETFGQFALHKIGYRTVKDTFELTSQVIVRCVSKVTDAYKLDKKVKRTFKPLGAISYDDRILRYKLKTSSVSIWTTQGRMEIPFVCGEPQKALLQTRQGESDLCLVKGKFFLLATCNVEEPTPEEIEGVLGCDFGIVEICTTSEGKSYSGEKIKALRKKLREHRRRLQECGTKSAKKRLKKAAKRQERFVRNSNHVISKELVNDAKASKKALGLEDLKGIRERARLNKEMRWHLGNWAFAQLRSFCEYKCRKEGVVCIKVDARNTSRTCHKCGHCEKGNRKRQKHFLCLACGHTENADSNASKNISHRGETLRASVSGPIVSTFGLGTSLPL